MSLKVKNLDLTKETSLLFIVKIFGAAFAFVVQIVINSLIGTEAYGTLSTYLAVAAVITTLVSIGTNTGIVKSVATSEDANSGKYIVYSIVIIFFQSVVLLFAGMLFKSQIFGYFNNSYSVLVLVFVYSIILSIYNAYTGFFQGKKKTLVVNLFDILAYNVVLLTFIAIFGGITKSVNYVLIAYIIATVVFLVVKQLYINHELGIRLAKKEEINVKDVSAFAVMCVPFCLITLCTSIQSMVMKLLLEGNLGGFEVGVFRILETYVSCMALFVSPFITMWPYMAEAYKNKKIKELNDIYAKATSVISALVIPTVVSMIICCKEVYAIFSLNYSEIQYAFMALSLMIISGAVDAIIGPAGALLNMTKYGHVNLFITAGSTVLSLVLSAFIIPSYGLIGAAMAVAVSKIITNIINAIMNKLLLKVWPYDFKLLLFILLSVPLYFIGNLLYGILPDVLMLRIIIIAVSEITLTILAYFVLFNSYAKQLINKIRHRR